MPKPVVHSTDVQCPWDGCGHVWDIDYTVWRGGGEIEIELPGDLDCPVCGERIARTDDLMDQLTEQEQEQ